MKKYSWSALLSRRYFLVFLVLISGFKNFFQFNYNCLLGNVALKSVILSRLLLSFKEKECFVKRAQFFG
jgi:hypothetical protein